MNTCYISAHQRIKHTVSTFSTFNKPILDVLVHGTRFIITLHRISVSCECFCRNNMTTGVTRIATVEPYEIAMLFFSNLLPHMVWQLVESFALTCAQARTRSIGSCVSFQDKTAHAKTPNLIRKKLHLIRHFFVVRARFVFIH